MLTLLRIIAVTIAVASVGMVLQAVRSRNKIRWIVGAILAALVDAWILLLSVPAQ